MGRPGVSQSVATFLLLLCDKVPLNNGVTPCNCGRQASLRPQVPVNKKGVDLWGACSYSSLWISVLLVLSEKGNPELGNRNVERKNTVVSERGQGSRLPKAAYLFPLRPPS